MKGQPPLGHHLENVCSGVSWRIGPRQPDTRRGGAEWGEGNAQCTFPKLCTSAQGGLCAWGGEKGPRSRGICSSEGGEQLLHFRPALRPWPQLPGVVARLATRHPQSAAPRPTRLWARGGGREAGPRPGAGSWGTPGRFSTSRPRRGPTTGAAPRDLLSTQPVLWPGTGCR